MAKGNELREMVIRLHNESKALFEAWQAEKTKHTDKPKFEELFRQWIAKDVERAAAVKELKQFVETEAW